MANTQQFLPIEDIKNDMVILKDGSVAMILQTSAVNFDLLSQNEQLAIIGSFAALLNSLSFPIQIQIRSKRLDISNYLGTLQKAEQTQTNPLLQVMMQHYRNFVATIIRENEVLDKQFYVIISVSSIELGFTKDTVKNLQKALTILTPRRDHILRQLGRIGLKTSQLSSQKLIRLFYDIYNEPLRPTYAGHIMEPEQLQPVATPLPVPQPTPMPPVPQAMPQSPTPQPQVRPQPVPQPAPMPSQMTINSQIATAALSPQASSQTAINYQQSMPPVASSPQPLAQVGKMPTTIPILPNTAMPMGQQPAPTRRAVPFVVEELPDEYGTT